MIMDRETGRPRGFAFITMSDVTGMENAIRELDGVELNGRSLKVNEAKPREPRENRYNNDGGGGGGGYNRNNNNSGKGSRKGNRGQDRW